MFPSSPRFRLVVLFALVSVVGVFFSGQLRLLVRAQNKVEQLLALTVTATMQDSFVTDTDGDGRADPGDKLKYTVNISAAGGDASGVKFQDTIDPNTTLDPTSITATAVAVNDSYTAPPPGNLTVAAGT